MGAGKCLAGVCLRQLGGDAVDVGNTGARIRKATASVGPQPELVHRARNLHQQLGQALLQFLTRRVNLVPLRDVDISAGDALRRRLTCALHDASTHLHPDPMAVLVAQPGLCLEEFGLPAEHGPRGHHARLANPQGGSTLGVAQGWGGRLPLATPADGPSGGQKRNLPQAGSNSMCPACRLPVPVGNVAFGAPAVHGPAFDAGRAAQSSTPPAQTPAFPRHCAGGCRARIGTFPPWPGRG